MNPLDMARPGSACPQCGLPMVWSDSQQQTWCSVFGRHRAVYPVVIGGRNTNALFAKLVDELDAMPLPADTRYAIKMERQHAKRRHLRAVS